MQFSWRGFILSAFSVGLVAGIVGTLGKDIQLSDRGLAQGQGKNNLEVSTASYLGGPEDDIAGAIAIAPDKTIVLSGKIPGNNFGKTPINLLGGGDGAILRTDATGKRILSVTRLGNIIDDLAIHQQWGKIAAVGDFGVALLDSRAQSILWHVSLGEGGGAKASNGRRVAVGNDGTVAALFRKKISVFDLSGALLGEFSVSGSFVEDLALDSETNSIIVTGYSQKDGGGCRQLQVAFLRSYDYAGNLNWRNYDWTHAEAHGGNSSCADTRGDRVTIGADGMLYFAAESAGGNTIFRYHPQDLSRDAPNVIFDAYNHPYNTASNHITYYARLQPETGAIEKGQFHLSRRSNGKGNTIVPRAIAVDEKGTLFVGGSSAAIFADRNEARISGQLGSYAAYDNFLLSVRADFSSRLFTVSWNQGCAGENQVVGIAAAYGMRAMISNTAGCEMITVDPIQATPQGGREILYSVWSADF